MNPALSIIVATSNRTSELERLMKSLASQDKIAGFSWEVVLVDNGDIDPIDALVQRYRNDFNLVHSREIIRGKSHALNHGVRIAQGKWVTFLDDDVTVASSWIVAFCRALMK